MTSNPFSRRDFCVRLAAFSGLGIAVPAVGYRGVPETAAFVGSEAISHTSEVIHQDVVFKASRKRVYEALTDTKQFDRVVQLSAAGMSYGTKPTEISRKAGGPFSLFGGYIVGRHIELSPNERIVQAWRVVAWKPGIYSIAKFELTEQGADTKVIFDHTGFPEGLGKSLAEGWNGNYWEPLEKYLALR